MHHTGIMGEAGSRVTKHHAAACWHVISLQPITGLEGEHKCSHLRPSTLLTQASKNTHIRLQTHILFTLQWTESIAIMQRPQQVLDGGVAAHELIPPPKVAPVALHGNQLGRGQRSGVPPKCTAKQLQHHNVASCLCTPRQVAQLRQAA